MWKAQDDVSDNQSQQKPAGGSAAPRRAPLNLQISVDLGMGIITDFHLKKKRQLHSKKKKKNYLEYSNNNQNNPDGIMGGFPVMINQSCLQCVVWSQLTAIPSEEGTKNKPPGS